EARDARRLAEVMGTSKGAHGSPRNAGPRASRTQRASPPPARLGVITQDLRARSVGWAPRLLRSFFAIRQGRRCVMYKHLLIPTDGSELSSRDEAAGLTLAKTLGAKVTALTVTPPFQFIGTDPMMLVVSQPEWEKAQAGRAEETLERVRSTAAAIGVPVETARAVSVQPFEGIIATAKERGCDLIFMASHGRSGGARLIVGSVTTKVLTHSKIPVLVYR